MCLLSTTAWSQSNPLWTQQKVKNYLPHMTVPEVEEFLKKSDMVLIPVGAVEQHGLHLPLGTDILAGIERSKLIAQQRDIIVCPVMMGGQSPYHMGFAGSITHSAETIIKVHMEAVESLIRHGFHRFIIMNAHGGNRAITTLLIDQINQTTSGVAVNFSQAISPFLEAGESVKATVLDRHGGTSETSRALYLFPSLVELDAAITAKLTLPDHLEKMLPQVVANDPTALMLFLAEGLKAEETGKMTSSAEMSTTGVWGERDPKESSAQRGERLTMRSVNAAVKFIDRWNELVPFKSDK
jgi:creatinine amidohydrolase